MDQIKHSIKEFILSQLLIGEAPHNLTDDLNLFENGIIDSLALLKLTLFLEEQFQIVIGENEALEKHYSTIGNIVLFVEKKNAEKTGTKERPGSL